MKNIQPYVAIVGVAIGVSMTATHYGLISTKDALLGVGFFAVMCCSFTVKWTHSSWVDENSRRSRLCPVIHRVLTALTIIVPLASIAISSLLTRWTPEKFDAVLMSVFSDSQPLLVVPSPPKERPDEIKSSQPYIAVFRQTSADVAPAKTALVRACQIIDSEYRFTPTFWCCIGIAGLLFFLWFIELASDFRATMSGPPGSPPSASSSPRETAVSASS